MCSNTTAQYDGAIAAWLTKEINPGSRIPRDEILESFESTRSALRREPAPEAQHSSAWSITRMQQHSLAYAQQLQGKELSYNNYLDLDAAWTAVREYDEPACVIVKHLTPCGVAVDTDVVSAYVRAHEADPVSAYGGVIAFNRAINAEVVVKIFDNKQFVEAIIAPEFSLDAVDMYYRQAQHAFVADRRREPRRSNR